MWFTLRVLFWCLLRCNLKVELHLIELTCNLQVSRKILWLVQKIWILSTWHRWLWTCSPFPFYWTMFWPRSITPTFKEKDISFHLLVLLFLNTTSNLTLILGRVIFIFYCNKFEATTFFFFLFIIIDVICYNWYKIIEMSVETSKHFEGCRFNWLGKQVMFIIILVKFLLCEMNH